MHALRMGYHFLSARAFPEIMVHFEGGAGDELICTAVAHELRKRGKGPIWVVANNAELFTGSNDVQWVIAPTSHQHVFASWWGIDYPLLEYAPLCESDRSVSPARHIIAELCARSGIVGSIDIRPYLKLDSRETGEAAWARNQIVIQSCGLAARHPILNKQWYPERFQRVVDALCGELSFIQLGSASDPALRNVSDLRGRTSIRETAAILCQARLYIGTVGFQMHLARAVNCPAVIIYGGREAPWQSGYLCNINLYNSVTCSPCWRWNTCDVGRKCMDEIGADDAVGAIREILTRPRSPLVTETIEISTCLQ